MGSPAVLEIVKELYSWYDCNGCYAAAVVVKTALQKSVIERSFVHDAVKIFINKTEAEHWLDVQKNMRS